MVGAASRAPFDDTEPRATTCVASFRKGPGSTLFTMTHWNEDQGRVSRAFDEWKPVDGDQRAFLRLGLQFAIAEYDRLWKETEQEPYCDGGPELIDSFEAKVDGLYSNDFQWML